MTEPVSCAVVRERLYHFQADELTESERVVLQAHLDTCPLCARRHAVEEGLLRGLRGKLPQATAPPELVRRVRAALRAETAAPRSAWRRGPWLLAAAASVLLGAFLLVGARPERPGGTLAAVERFEQELTVVDLDCDRAGLGLHRQRGCIHPHHVNALKTADGRYLNIGLDRPAGRRLATDRTMRGHRVRVEGDLYGRIGTLRLTRLIDLGLQL